MAEFEDADAVVEVLAWLRSDPDVLAAFGGPDHVTGLMEAPWPHLRVAASAGGDAGDLTWDSRPEVVLEVYGDPQGTVGSAALRRLLLLVGRVLKRMPATRDVGAGETVVCDVRPVGAAAPQTLSSGQARWTMTVSVTIHPGI